MLSRLSRTPLRGRVPDSLRRISGAQNLSGWYQSLPGHWALGLGGKNYCWCVFLPRLALLSKRWASANASLPGAQGGPYPNFLKLVGGGAEGESAEGREKPPWGVPLPWAGLGPAPTRGNASASLFAVGAAHLGRPILGPLSLFVGAAISRLKPSPFQGEGAERMRGG